MYPLHPRRSANGDGRLGSLDAPCSLAELGGRLKTCLEIVTPCKSSAPLTRPVRQIAIICAHGGELLSDVLAVERYDVFLTGELRFHDYLRAQAQELALLLPGHYALGQRPASKCWPNV